MKFNSIKIKIFSFSIQIYYKDQKTAEKLVNRTLDFQVTQVQITFNFSEGRSKFFKICT